MTLSLALLLVLVVAFVAIHFHLLGEDLSRFDGQVKLERFPGRPLDHLDHADAHRVLAGAESRMHLPLRQRLPALRQYMDEVFGEAPTDTRFVPVTAATVKGEWVLAPGARAERRLLFIHGGSFAMGSPRSHRRLTQKFSEVTGAAVFAVDYRLLPEHSRRSGIEDCRAAYQWLLANGPEGAAPASAVFVAGDSAGGNLTLSLIAWLRDQGLRAPDAVVALSPVTDASLTGPSVRGNLKTDLMLASTVKPLLPIMPLLPWGMALLVRTSPSNPMIAPIHGTLERLPPTLIQCSEAEMLLDDCRRYAAKAQLAGSPVRLQTWAHMVHVWQIFTETAEAQAAFAEIERFIEGISPRVGAAGA